jgi:RNA polymerase sigma factor (sigma-70 family)
MQTPRGWTGGGEERKNLECADRWESAVSAPGVHSGLSQGVRDLIEKARSQGSFTRPELDRMLAALAPERFEAELEHLAHELSTFPLAREPSTGTSSFQHGLPGAGRISRRYLKELDRYPPMNREQEVAAAKRLEFALERIEQAEFRPPAIRAARRTEYQLLFNEFVERNLHIVVSEVYGYRTYDVPLDDLVQEGNAALMHAVEKFDWRKGVRFRTYVAWWIKQAVERHLASTKGAVRVPHHLQQKLRRLKRQGLLPKGFEGGTSLAEVADAFRVDRDHAGRLVESSRKSFSLEQEINDEGDRFRDMIAESWEPRDSERRATLQNRIRGLLADLDERERIVLRLRFGLDGRKARTLEEVGSVLHLSRERSRQIQQSALLKLRERAARTSLKDEI